MKTKIEELIASAMGILDTADEATEGVLTEEQQTEYDGIMSKVASLKSQLERRAAIDAMKADLDAPLPVKANIQPTTGLEVKAGQEDPQGGFGGDEHAFAMAVVAACSPVGHVDERLRIVADDPTSPHKGVGTAEGFMIPADMRDGIWELVREEPDILNLLTIEPTQSNRVNLVADETTPWAATGVQANWQNEAGKFTETNLDTEGRSVPLHKLVVLVTATEEILEDAPLLNNRLTVRAAEAIRWKASEAVVKGTGAGQPLGWNPAAGGGPLIAVEPEGGQAADTITAQNVADMYSRMIPSGHSDGVCISNPDTLPQFLTMTLGNQPIWTPPQSGFANAPGGFLFGRPIMLSQHAETVGDEGDIYYISPSGYYATNKAAGIKAASSIHLFFAHDVQAFRWTFRFGGEPFLSKAVAANNGPNTQSHFVALAERT